MEKVLRDKKMILLFVGPALLLYVTVMLYPILHAIYLSFFQWDMLGDRKFLGVGNYVRILTRDDLVPRALLHTLGILVASLAGQQIFGFLFASALSHGTKYKNLFKNLFFLPSVLSSAAVGSMWSFIYNPKAGLINYVLRMMGLDVLTRQWLTDEKVALGAICVVVVWQFTGYSMTLFMAAIQGIPPELYESAKIDGASPISAMRHITLPLITPIIKVNTVLVTVGSLKFFDLVYVMTPGGGPNRTTEVLASYLYRRAFTNFEYGYGNALAIILLVLCLAATGIINRAFKNVAFEY